jgi:hypothetical protein
LHAEEIERVIRLIKGLTNKIIKVMTATVGTLAGAVWTALNENGALNSKDLKKVAKIKSDKDLYLALGWLLREDKVVVAEADKVMTITLK